MAMACEADADEAVGADDEAGKGSENKNVPTNLALRPSISEPHVAKALSKEWRAGYLIYQ